jgi:hypothetical protein
MIHQPASSYYDGQAGECIMEAKEVLNFATASPRFMYKERVNFYGLFPKIWKETFLCRQNKQKFMVLLIL